MKLCRDVLWHIIDQTITLTERSSVNFLKGHGLSALAPRLKCLSVEHAWANRLSTFKAHGNRNCCTCTLAKLDSRKRVAIRTAEIQDHDAMNVWLVGLQPTVIASSARRPRSSSKAQDSKNRGRASPVKRLASLCCIAFVNK